MNKAALRKSISTLLEAVQAADPVHHGWRLVEDIIGVDPWLLCEWFKEGEQAGPLYQLDADGDTAWGYASRLYGGFIVADTVADEPYVCTGNFGDITRRIIAGFTDSGPRMDWLWLESYVCPQTLEAI
jgi:hypothetical protein